MSKDKYLIAPLAKGIEMKRAILVSAAIGACLAGCSTTYETLKTEVHPIQASIESTPPGLQAYYKTKYLGKTPTVFQGKYKHIEQKITFGGYRLGLGMLITGGVGIAVGGGMVGGGAALGSSEGAVLIGLGAVGALYGLVGLGYGAIAMIGSPAPRIVKKTVPGSMSFGVKTEDGRLTEAKIVPIDSKKGWVNFGEINKVTFESSSGTISVEGMKTLKKEN